MSRNRISVVLAWLLTAGITASTNATTYSYSSRSGARRLTFTPPSGMSASGPARAGHVVYSSPVGEIEVWINSAGLQTGSLTLSAMPAASSAAGPQTWNVVAAVGQSNAFGTVSMDPTTGSVVATYNWDSVEGILQDYRMTQEFAVMQDLEEFLSANALETSGSPIMKETTSGATSSNVESEEGSTIQPDSFAGCARAVAVALGAGLAMAGACGTAPVCPSCCAGAVLAYGDSLIGVSQNCS